MSLSPPCLGSRGITAGPHLRGYPSRRSQNAFSVSGHKRPIFGLASSSRSGPLSSGGTADSWCFRGLVRERCWGPGSGSDSLRLSAAAAGYSESAVGKPCLLCIGSNNMCFF